MEKQKGPIAWMCCNRVAANLLMLLFLIGGVVICFQLKQEIIPETEFGSIAITVPFPGASPEEVERAVLFPIEQAIEGEEGIKKITSTAFEGMGQVYLDLLPEEKPIRVHERVRETIETIDFSEEVLRPVVRLNRISSVEAVQLLFWGDHELKTLRAVAEKVRDELVQSEGITRIDVYTPTTPEIEVEVSESALRKHALSLKDIVGAIKGASVEIPGGVVRSSSGDLLLKTKGSKSEVLEFAKIPIIIEEDGSKVFLGQIAKISERQQSRDYEETFNGFPFVRLGVFSVGVGETPVSVADKVKAYVEKVRSELPSTIKVKVASDFSEMYRDRMHLVLKNAVLGLILVLILLGLFLDPRLAFWVALGVPVSIVGAFLFFPLFGISINMISLFAFLVTIGIVVDDAIVIGENIYQKLEKGQLPQHAAIVGANEVSMPVVFAVLTNMVAFVPFFFLHGMNGAWFFQIGVIVVGVFFISLIESLFILPSHLSFHWKKRAIWDLLSVPSRWIGRKLRCWIEAFYSPFLHLVQRYRYLTFSTSLGICILLLGVYWGGYLHIQWYTPVDGDMVTAKVELPFGVPMKRAREAKKQLEEGAKRVFLQQNEEISRGVCSTIGSGGAHLITVCLELIPAGERTVDSFTFAKLWRQETGEIIGAKHVNFHGMMGHRAGSTLEIAVSHRSNQVTEQAVADLQESLSEYKGVYEVESGLSQGKPQLAFKLKPEGQALGMTTQSLAEEMRLRFHGGEVLNLQREKEEVKVIVSLPEEEKTTLHSLEQLVLCTPGGGEISLSEAAECKRESSPKSISRLNGRRAVTLLARVDEDEGSLEKIKEELDQTLFPFLKDKYPGVALSFEGMQRERGEMVHSLQGGFILVLFAIYALLAIPFRSYFQPLIVMMSIPFGLIGAVLGHLILGYSIDFLSFLGMVALSGVVINDALVLVATANQYRDERSLAPFDAMLEAAKVRLRPILLTSLTTFFGLMPMIFERSLQARFLTPMAISLGCGILFATFVVLLLVPALYLILEDLKPRIKPIG